MSFMSVASRLALWKPSATAPYHYRALSLSFRKANMSTKLSKCCVSGHLHSGTPEGQEQKVAGLDAYVTGTNSSKTVMAITDIFGYKLINVRLFADELAKSGNYRVVVPDFFKGDSVDVKHMKVLTPLNSDPVPSEEDKKTSMGAAFGEVGPWLERQKDEVVRPLIKQAAATLKSESEKLGVIGFCWGGRQSILLGGDHSGVDAIVANHPSYTEFPAAFEADKVPTLIQVGDNDSMFPPDQVKTVKEEIFAKTPSNEVRIYPGAVHGFTIRNDQNNDDEVRQKDDAVSAALAFFAKYL